MAISYHDPVGVYPPAGPSAHAISVANPKRLLFISGTMGLDPEGAAGATIEAQLDLVWSNIGKIQADAGMTVANLGQPARRHPVRAGPESFFPANAETADALRRLSRMPSAASPETPKGAS